LENEKHFYGKFIFDLNSRQKVNKSIKDLLVFHSETHTKKPINMKREILIRMRNSDQISYKINMKEL